jgi:CheY-like chemotaxis protein
MPPLAMKLIKKAPKLQALLIEDNRLIQKAHKLMLEDLDFQVEVVDCGSAALNLIAKHSIEKHPYDAALVDIGLPDISGIDVVKALRKNNPHIKIIVATTEVDKTVIKNCSEAGSNFVLSKPLSLKTLEALRMRLGSHKLYKT